MKQIDLINLICDILNSKYRLSKEEKKILGLVENHLNKYYAKHKISVEDFK